jgi:chromosome segregation ATPase
MEEQLSITEETLRKAVAAKEEQLRQAVAAKEEQLCQAVAAKEEQLRQAKANSDKEIERLRQAVMAAEKMEAEMQNRFSAAQSDLASKDAKMGHLELQLQNAKVKIKTK